MKYTFANNQKCFSTFIAEEYFPIIIEFSKEELNNHFIELTTRILICLSSPWIPKAKS